MMMVEEKTYEGVIAEVWRPAKILKIILDISEEDLEKLMFKLNKKVKVIIEE